MQNNSSFGAYIHIPYCIQRCTYCDFATYEQKSILPPEKYIELVLAEIDQRQYFAPRPLDTIYFGGGTPSLIAPNLIVTLIKGLEKAGFTRKANCELTIEINPATVSEDKLKFYLDNGVNRFSVGAQTFKDDLLKFVHREHSTQDTLNTLKLLAKYQTNFSFDILFALPGQTLQDLQRDLDFVEDIGASHISPYCLTVPESHPLSQNRPHEDEQVDMFEMIRERLSSLGFARYEISNFAKPGFESRHNLLYWQDSEYMSLGLSAHSYLKNGTQWGLRYWNDRNINNYENQILSHEGKSFHSPIDQLPDGQFEVLSKNQALTDFCHTSLRLLAGLGLKQLKTKFGEDVMNRICSIGEDLVQKQILVRTEAGFALSDRGVLISNQVFEKFTFLDGEI